MDSKIAIKQKSFFEIKKDIRDLSAAFPFLNLKVLARSTLGREIYSCTIGKADEYVYFIAPFCGDETYISVILLRFLEELSHAIYSGEEIAGVNIRKATANKGIVFVPLLNPDGQEIALKGYSAASYLCNIVKQNAETDYKAFKYNLRGVYLENNFFKQAVGTPYKNCFAGFSPFSEPETLCLAENLRRYPPRQIVSLTEQQDFIGYYCPNDSTRTEKMLEVINAVYPKKQVLKDTPTTFGSWVKNEFSVPTFSIGLKGLNENNLLIHYNRLKELLVLMLIM